MTEAEARAEVVRKAQTGVEPVLDSAEIDAALASNRRFTLWEAGAEVEHGNRVAPTVRNGHRYRAIQGGTTGATEPTWSASDYARVTDGDVVWEEDGMAGDEWSVRGAVYECLTIKLAKASEYTGAEEERIRTGILELMKLYRPVGIA